MKDGSSRTWTINGDFVGLHPTGVARYAREVTLALDSLLAERHPLAAGLDIAIVAPRPPMAPLDLAVIPLRVVPEFARPRLPQVWVQAQLPFHLDGGGLVSFCNLAPVAVRRQIVCIHDLQTRLFPKSYGRMFRAAHRVVLPLLGRQARAIATVSDLSRQNLVKFGVAPAEKIVVTYNGHEHALRWNAERSTLDPGAGRPFVLCLGRDQKHKNTELMWSIAAPLDRMGIDILIAGEVQPREIGQDPAAVPSNIRLLGRVSDDDFARLLKTALAFVFPSRIEGFGLPALEAMALGAPVIASTAPCLPEICGDATLYADPEEPAAWVTAIGRLRNEPGLRATLARKGPDRARLYSWRTIAETYLGLMARIDRDNAA